jgi:hypothetical protein
MNYLTDDILRVAFNLQKGESLSEEQQAICLEWMTGKAQEYLKISIDDPRLLEKCLRWKQID